MNESTDPPEHEKEKPAPQPAAKKQGKELKEVEDMKKAAQQQLANLQQFADRIRFDPKNIDLLDPALKHYQEANKLVQTPVPDPLANIEIDEIGVIAQLAVLEQNFTVKIPVNDKGKFDPEYRDKDGNQILKQIGGLPGAMAGIDRFINLTPAIDGKRAELFASAIKPALPNRPETEPLEEKPGLFERIKDWFGRVLGGGGGDRE